MSVGVGIVADFDPEHYFASSWVSKKLILCIYYNVYFNNSFPIKFLLKNNSVIF
ncbi:hypothetical protein XBKB1_3990002 [Xenorhabdus bovienii str. kraussei Becker Underwood]|uniref:Uncharacterized protein n=1 Tax=Xenorhabdus bovienii str. kraussei Becker Underwood TaxID=1398204 RepID=A0A077PW77_XENBV|nr:hypothetical protein XBKB1_3990002 [Xenorhabdus bovienii str. kraussei Becker Underwood]